MKPHCFVVEWGSRAKPIFREFTTKAAALELVKTLRKAGFSYRWYKVRDEAELQDYREFTQQRREWPDILKKLFGPRP